MQRRDPNSDPNLNPHPNPSPYPTDGQTDQVMEVMERRELVVREGQRRQLQQAKGVG